MAVNYKVIATQKGLDAIAAAMRPVSPVPLTASTVIVGDGNGNPVTPIQTQTGLVNQRAEVPVSVFTQVDNVLTIKGVLDAITGGFTIREFGIKDNTGTLLFVGNYPDTYKPLPDEGVAGAMMIGAAITFSDAANVQIVLTGTTYATIDQVNALIAANRTDIRTPLRPYHITVKSLTLAAPPSSPAPGEAYIVPVDATGVWAGQVGKMTQYISASVGWVFRDMPIGHLVTSEANGLIYQRKADATWPVFIPANTVADKARWLQDNNGVRSWTEPLDLSGRGATTLTQAIQVPTFDPATNVVGKASVGDLTAALLLSDYLHAQMFFLGMQ